MFNYITYLLNLLRLNLWIFLGRKLEGRFEKYSPDVDLSKHDQIGLLANKSDWNHATPNLNRKENISLIASNTFDQSSLNLQLKWRPNSELSLVTLLTKLSLELNGVCLDYDNVETYQPTNSTIHRERITQYGPNGAYLKFHVIVPYVKYRISFRGYMRRRDSPEKLCFVKINFLALKTSKVYDFKETFDVDYIAYQVSDKRPKCGLRKALDELVLHDRHEHTVRLFGEYAIQQDSNDKIKTKHRLNLWGFHSREFVDEKTQNMRSKRVLAHFDNGRAFHLGLCESINNNFDPNQQFTAGWACFHIGPALGPISRCDNPIDWSRVSGETMALNFNIAAQDWNFQVEASRRQEPKGSQFMNMTINKSSGWALIVINDALDTSAELRAIDDSLKEYQSALKVGDIVDPKLFDSGKKFNSKPICVLIDDLDCAYSSLVGAKASSLAQLRVLAKSARHKENFEVPPAVVLTRYAYEAIQEANPQLKGEVRRLEAQIGRGSLDELAHDCERLQDLFQREVTMPGEIGDQLSAQMQLQFHIDNISNLDGRSFAVRSSSWGEDEEDMSAAGQLTTVLAVKGFETLIEAIKKCFASKFSHTNVEYKRQHGLPLDMPMAIVVQEMIESEKAGVMFTCDPTNGDEGCLTITANYGLGESVVSAQTDPDSIRVRVEQTQRSVIGAHNLQVDFRVSIEEKKIGEKKVILSSASVGPEADKNTNGREEQGSYDRKVCCLSEQETLDLAKCGQLLARYFNSPRDIEWGFKGAQLYLFQSRPVTGLDAYTETEMMHEGDSPSRAELEFATRCNVCEVMPKALSPFNSSYPVKSWGVMGAKLFRKLGTVKKEDYSLNCSPDIIVNNYLPFFPLRAKALFDFADYGGERSLISRANEIGIFGHEVNDPELVEKATEMTSNNMAGFSEFKFNYHTFKYQLMPFKVIEEAKRELFRLRRDVNSLRFSKSGSSMEGLYEQLQTVFRYAEKPLLTHLVGTISSSKVNYSLLQLLSKYIKEPTQLYSAFSKFLATSPDVLSAQIPKRISKMAKLISERGGADVEAFVSMSPKDGLKYVSKDLKSELAKEFDDFMVLFGHRGYCEFEIAEMTWHDAPEDVVQMLQQNVQRYLTPNESPIDENSKESLTIEQVISSLKINLSFWDKLRLKYYIAPRCQKYVSVRERTKDIAVEQIDVLRDASRLLAREMRQNNRIPDEDLFYYLFYYELEAIVREPQPAIVAQLNKRRRLFKIFEPKWRFDEIVRGHEMIPLHLKPSKELDEKLAKAPKLIGTTASSGRAKGKVCLVEGYEGLGKVRAGDILLTYSTDIAFSPVFPLVAGVITEVGGLISHGAVIAREYGIPSVIGIDNVTKILRDGEEIILDADKAAIIRLEMKSQ